MTVLVLSLCSAIAYGLSDFTGGILTRRASAWAVAATSQAAATVLALSLLAVTEGEPDVTALLWGALAGIGSGAGNVLIYRGLAIGRMTVVAPLSAIAAATLPVLVGLASGERPGALPILGVTAALPAIWLVSGSSSGLSVARRADLINGLLAGLGFGLQFSALGQVPEQAGLAPLAVSQVVSVAAIVIGAHLLSAPWIPRDRFSRLGVVAGLFAGIATICFQFAAQSGMLTITAVVTSLYPAATVLLAALVLRERVGQTQGIGLALAAVAVALIASG
jgi:drug/metabolite transporter (DMT)-like permease